MEASRKFRTKPPPPALVEAVVQLVRQSAAVQEARLDALLDGATLAAEQVQDVRLQVIEEPAEVTGWDIFVEIAPILIIESKVPAKLLANLTKRLLGPAVRSNALFLALPKSQAGKELVKAADDLARLGLIPRGDVAKQVAKLAGTASGDSVKLYSAGTHAIINFGSGTDYAQAVITAGQQGYRRATAPTNPPLRAADSAGVAVVGAAMNYAAATRLAIRFSHARIEAFCRTEATLTDLAAVGVGMDWDPLEDPNERSPLPGGLAEARGQYQLFFEAVIWARMYGFSHASIGVPGSRNHPPISTNDPAAPFVGPKKALQQYWLSRFGAEAERYATAMKVKIPESPTAAALRLRRYLGDISTQVDVLGPRGALQPLRPVEGP
jgi:hypothetical protein